MYCFSDVILLLKCIQGRGESSISPTELYILYGWLHWAEFLTLIQHGTIILAGIICKKIPC